MSCFDLRIVRLGLSINFLVPHASACRLLVFELLMFHGYQFVFSAMQLFSDREERANVVNEGCSKTLTETFGKLVMKLLEKLLFRKLWSD